MLKIKLEKKQRRRRKQREVLLHCTKCRDSFYWAKEFTDEVPPRSCLGCVAGVIDIACTQASQIKDEIDTFVPDTQAVAESEQVVQDSQQAGSSGGKVGDEGACIPDTQAGGATKDEAENQADDKNDDDRDEGEAESKGADEDEVDDAGKMLFSSSQRPSYRQRRGNSKEPLSLRVGSIELLGALLKTEILGALLNSMM